MILFSMKCRGENSLCEDFSPNMADDFHDNFDVNSDRSDSPACGSQEYYDRGHGHYFVKKTFHKPTYCHHCTDMLWGLIQQGLVCEGNTVLIYANILFRFNQRLYASGAFVIGLGLFITP